MVEVQCSSCHTRYRVDEQVLPEGTPTFKCSRCGHVFSVEPRKTDEIAAITPKLSAPPPPAASGRLVHQESKPPPVDASTTTPTASSPKVEPLSPDREPSGMHVPSAAAMHNSPAEMTAPAPPPLPGPVFPTVDKPSASIAKTGNKSDIFRHQNTAELMSRPFRSEPQPPDAGENMAFDFRDDGPIGNDPAPAGLLNRDSPTGARGGNGHVKKEPTGWQVGDDPDLAVPLEAPGRFSAGRPPRERNRAVNHPYRHAPEMLDEDEAPIYNRGVTRSARYFLALCVLVAAAFGAATFAIHTAPAAALDLLNRIPIIGARFVSPVVPARAVALRDVHTEYRRGRDGRLMLVIEGQAENVAHAPLHTIRIMSRIWTPSGGAVARRQIYCGNSLATRTIPQMTTHEIDFYQQLSPPKTFTLEPLSASPFVVVFVDPPAQVSHFDIAVTEADPVIPDDSPSPVG